MVRFWNLWAKNDPREATTRFNVWFNLLLFKSASQRVLCVTGEVSSTANEIHVIETDGSGTNPRETGFGKGRD